MNTQEKAQSLQNAADKLGLFVHIKHQTDKRKKTPLFFLTQNGVSISPVLDYSNMNHFILGYSKAVKSYESKDFLPPAMVYAEYLKKASQLFNLSIDECRNRFGAFTEKQWKMILI
jgi:hypothetical protein